MIKLEPRGLRAARFAGQLRVYHSGKALVADAELSADSDLDLANHLPDGALMLPAVLAMEAMAQAAARLTTADRMPVLEDVRFLRPIVIPDDGSVTVRIAASGSSDSVQVTLRSSGTGFRADHARATLRYAGARPLPTRRRPIPSEMRVPLDPATDLYGGIPSRSGRFPRVVGFHRLAAQSCVAEISAAAGGQRREAFPATDAVLGDPGARDAFLHAVQSCVPDATLLPVAVERLYPAGSFGPGGPADDGGQVILYAAERHRHGGTYTYDLDVHAACGRLLERWEGLRLVAVGENDVGGPWAPALLGPYLEGRLARLLAGKHRCVVEPDTGEPGARRGQITAAVRRMLGRPALVWYRDDGKPEVAEEGIFVSAAHSAGLLLVVAGAGRTGCDARPVRQLRPGQWRALLGPELMALAGLIERERGEPLPVAATRVWSAAECLRETGWSGAAPLTLARSRTDGWVVLACGQARIASFPTHLRGGPDPVTFTILTEGCGNGSVLRIPPRGRFRGDQPRRERLLHQLRALAGPMPGDVPAGARAQRPRLASR